MNDSVIEVNSATPEIIEHAEKDAAVEYSEKPHYVDVSNLPIEVIERIAPQGGEAFILEKIATMEEDEALEILTEAIDYHSDDFNFPQDMYEKMKVLVKGEKLSGMSPEEWKLELRIEAALIRWYSPYPEVRAVTDMENDYTVPIETIRSWFLSIVWTSGGVLINTFFASRFPGLHISSSVVQLLMYPCGKACEYLLPDWGFTFRGVRHSLNPGPWTYKEQMFATITFHVAISTTNSYNMIMVQRLKVYYGNDWVDFGYQILVTLFFQLLGFGIAGIFRRIVIYPVKALWPSILYTLAMNRALLRPEKQETINGWTLSRYKSFWLFFFGMFIYWWIPDYLFKALSTFNWITWIAPHNYNLAVITGSSFGLGLNPITTFDFNVMVSSFSAMTTPFWSVVHQYAGTVVGFFCIVGMFYSNYYWTGYLPPNSNNLFANDGSSYNVSKVVKNNLLDEEAYQAYSPPYLSAGKLLQTGASFFVYPLYFMYMVYRYWRMLKRGFIDVYRGFFHGQKNYEGFKDRHSELNSYYKEAPDWWFFVIFVVALVLGIVCVEVYPMNTPVWFIFLLIAISILFMGPLAILNSMSGVSFGLLYLMIIIAGYCLPGNAEAQMVASMLGGWGIVGQSDDLLVDLKLAHYSRIPQRATFRGQIISTIVAIVVAVAIENWQMTSIKDICTPTQEAKFTCASSALSTYSSSVIWGLIGPKRVFSGQYKAMKYAFLMGFLFGCFQIGCLYIGENYGERIKAYAARRYSEKTYEKLDKYFFRPVAYARWINPVLVLQGTQSWCPSNMSYFTPAIILAWVFNYYIKKRYILWWEKYTYIIAASFYAGIAVCGMVMFGAVQYHPKKLIWWGNTVSSAGIDGTGKAGYLPLPETGYFGLPPGHFP